MQPRGQSIVIYGSPNLGKTTQSKRLVMTLKEYGMDVEYIKYPIYDLEPTGPRLNRILREHTENLSYSEIQEIFVQNRRDFEPHLQEMLDAGKVVVAEDYVGTGIAWGLTYGISLETMEEMNAGLFVPDISILLSGERFTDGIERSHLHEAGDKWEVNRGVHLRLAERYGWSVVNATQSEEKVANDIFEIVSPLFLR